MTGTEDQVSPNITIAIGLLMLLGAFALLATGYPWLALPLAGVGLAAVSRSWLDKRGRRPSQRVSWFALILLVGWWVIWFVVRDI